ncbi:MAG: polyprenyl synthetase family protein [Cytophagales bacterium]|nr:polyprenyl synthetase family protein [Cytophagales bacterium]
MPKIFDVSHAQNLINEQIKMLEMGHNPAELYDPITYFLHIGGKRMRPLLCMMGYYLYNDDYESVAKPALITELFHNFTLVHDDIMDNAPLRRGQPTIHEKWNKNIALLAGDVTFVKAYELFEYIDPNIRWQIFKHFNTTAIQVCEGQQYDMNFETVPQISLVQYLHMIQLKTAVLLGFSMCMGAAMAGANDTDSNNIYDAAVKIGVAFQVKDDYLDVFGQAHKVGKKLGGDIVANKKTFLATKALEKANKDQKNELFHWFQTKNHDNSSKITHVTQLYLDLGIKQETEDFISIQFNDAISTFETMNIAEHKKQFIIQFFNSLMQRDS